MGWTFTHASRVISNPGEVNCPPTHGINSFSHCKYHLHLDGLMQERRNSIAYALELHLSCTDLSIYLLWQETCSLYDTDPIPWFKFDVSDIKYEPALHPWEAKIDTHYSDIIMSTMASQITSLIIVYSTVYSGADQRKHQSSASLASNVENVSIWWRRHGYRSSEVGSYLNTVIPHEQHEVSNNWKPNNLFNSLFRETIKKTRALHYWPLF